MGRKKRKRARKRKSQKKQLDKRTNDVLWKIARFLTKEASSKMIGKPVNEKAYCDKCQRLYCLNFVGKDSYCNECWMNPNKEGVGKNYVGCIKELQHIRLCQECEK